MRDLKLKLARAAAVGQRFLQPGAEMLANGDGEPAVPSIAGAHAVADRIYADVQAVLEVNRALINDEVPRRGCCMRA